MSIGPRPLPVPQRQATGPHAAREVPQPFGVVNSDGTPVTTITAPTASPRAPLVSPNGSPAMPNNLPT